MQSANCRLLQQSRQCPECCNDTTGNTTQDIPRSDEWRHDGLRGLLYLIQVEMQPAFVVVLYCIVIFFKDTIQYNIQRLQYNMGGVGKKRAILDNICRDMV